MLVLNKVRIIISLLLVCALPSCITLPGHRQIIDEDGFYLKITAPNKETKSRIRFNSQKDEISYLPAKARIELAVVDVDGTHELDIRNSSGAIAYEYRLNGRKIPFGAAQREWFALQVPRIISKTGLKYGPD